MTQASEVRQDPSRNIMACENEILHSKQGPYRNRITQVPETAFPMSVSHRQARPSFIQLSLPRTSLRVRCTSTRCANSNP